MLQKHIRKSKNSAWVRGSSSTGGAALQGGGGAAKIFFKRQQKNANACSKNLNRLRKSKPYISEKAELCAPKTLKKRKKLSNATVLAMLMNSLVPASVALLPSTPSSRVFHYLYLLKKQRKLFQ